MNLFIYLSLLFFFQNQTLDAVFFKKVREHMYYPGFFILILNIFKQISK